MKIKAKKIIKEIYENRHKHDEGTVKVCLTCRKPLSGHGVMCKIEPNDFGRILEESREERRRQKEEENEKRFKDDRTGTCVFCAGEVIAKVTREYLGDPMHMIIGPGSKNQMVTVHHGFHCTNCGLKYEFPSKLSMNDT